MDHAEFGRYLTQQRELRGLTRADVSAKTKIPNSVLIALEQGQAERLPGRVFVLNYVRAYAQVIGLAPEEAVLRYEEIHTASATVLNPVELERRRRGRAWRTLVTLLILAAAVAAAIVLWRQQAG